MNSYHIEFDRRENISILRSKNIEQTLGLHIDKIINFDIQTKKPFPQGEVFKKILTLIVRTVEIYRKENRIMKETGIVRPIDELGRVVIPKELRKVFGIKDRDELEIFVENNMIILKKYEPTCVFCEGTESVVSLNEKFVCSECIKKLNEISVQENFSKSL